MHPLPSSGDLPPLSGDPSFFSTALDAERTVGRPALGEWVGPYKVLGLLGSGGMGAVYAAEQETPIRRRVALKIIKPGLNSAQIVARFEMERQTLAQMNHENIARMFDAGATAQGLPYFVMELVAGVPITIYCDEKRLTVDKKLELFLSVCRAIEYTHRQGIIHRDLKPSNILVTQQDGKPTAKIIDFGVARATEQERVENDQLTEIGAIVGTLAYMAPEQAEMSAQGITTLADVYSLGTICFELLTGILPHPLKGKTRTEMVRIIRERDAVPLRSVNASLSRDLEAIVAKALEKDERRRYQSAAELTADLERYLNDEPIHARPAGNFRRFWKYVKRHKVKAGGVAVLGTAALLAGWAVLERERAEAAEKEKSYLQEVAALKERERLRREADGFAEAARRAARQGQWRGAVASFDKALQVGHNDRALQRLGKARALLALREEQLCDAEIEALIQENNWKQYEGAVLLLRGEMRLGRDDIEAEQLFRAALTKNLAPGESAYAQALLAGKAPQALALLRQALALDPYHHRARVSLELLLLLTARLDEARNELHAHRVIFPDDVEHHLLQMLLLALEGNRTEAAAELDACKHRLEAGDAEAIRKTADFLSAFRAGTNRIDPISRLLDLDNEWKAVQPSLRHLWPALLADGRKQPLAPPRLPLVSRLPPLLRKNLERLPSIVQKVMEGIRLDKMPAPTVEGAAWAALVLPEGTVLYLNACALFGAYRWEEADRAAENAAKTSALLPVHAGALNIAAASKGMLYYLFCTEPDPVLSCRAVEAFALNSRSAFFALAAAHGIYVANRQSLLPRSLANLRELLAQNRHRPLIPKIAVNLARLAGEYSLARQILDDWKREDPKDLEMLKLKAITECNARAFLPALEATDRYLKQKSDDAEMQKYKVDLVEELRKQAQPYLQEKKQ